MSASGLLKDRIIITYPEDAEKQDPMGVLAAATREWMDKCEHWNFYCVNQHYKQVNPILVVQVQAGSGENKLSQTDLDAALEKISQVTQRTFEEGEVVHTFGSTCELTINGLKVPHVEPTSIAGDRNIKVVLFKENLSTGWDCPRAETMMSFRRAEDYTYIAQLLGRMIRTPLQCHVNVDDSLNEVKLYLPYYNAETVDKVIEELRSSECGDIPTVVDSEALGSGLFTPWTAKARIKRRVEDPNQMNLFVDLPKVEPKKTETQKQAEIFELSQLEEFEENEPHPQQVPTPKPIIVTKVVPESEPTDAGEKVEVTQPTLQLEIDRQDIIKRINSMGLIRYEVRTQAQHIHDYLQALLRLAALLSRTRICVTAQSSVFEEIVDMIYRSIQQIKAAGKYDGLEKKIREMKLESKIFDAFGASLAVKSQMEFTYVTESDLDRQYRVADTILGRAGITNAYGRKYAQDDDGFKVDCIIFATDSACMEQVNAYARQKFHELDDANRIYVATANERVQREYDEIVASGEIVSRHNFILPETVQPFVSEEGILYYDHLYADESGAARIAFDSAWEPELLEAERRRDDFVCWLRNPPRTRWSLCVPYDIGAEKRGFYPDFMVVRRDYNPQSTSGYIVDVLEPHSSAFADNLAKAKGLAAYASESKQLGRVQMIRQEKALGGGGRFRRLDFARGAVREQVKAATTEAELNHLFDLAGEVDS